MVIGCLCPNTEQNSCKSSNIEGNAPRFAFGSVEEIKIAITEFFYGIEEKELTDCDHDTLN